MGLQFSEAVDRFPKRFTFEVRTAPSVELAALSPCAPSHQFGMAGAGQRLVCSQAFKARPSGACLERLKETGQNFGSGKDSGKTKAGPVVTTRRVVASKPGLVGHKSRVPGEV